MLVKNKKTNKQRISVRLNYGLEHENSIISQVLEKYTNNIFVILLIIINIFVLGFLLKIIIRICYKNRTIVLEYLVCFASFYLNCNTISELCFTITVRGGGKFLRFILWQFFLPRVRPCPRGPALHLKQRTRSLWERYRTGKLVCDICATWLNCGYRYLRPSYAPWAKSEIFLERKTRSQETCRSDFSMVDIAEFAIKYAIH